MFSYVFNEYVVPNFSRKSSNKWIVEYEPLDSIPVVQGTLEGILSNNFVSAVRLHNENNDVFLNERTGVITIAFNDKPNDEHYLCVSYESGENYHQKVNWLQEGF